MLLKGGDTFKIGQSVGFLSLAGFFFFATVFLIAEGVVNFLIGRVSSFLTTGFLATVLLTTGGDRSLSFCC